MRIGLGLGLIGLRGVEAAWGNPRGETGEGRRKLGREMEQEVCGKSFCVCVSIPPKPPPFIDAKKRSSRHGLLRSAPFAESYEYCSRRRGCNCSRDTGWAVAIREQEIDLSELLKLHASEDMQMR
ncbi:hypothetical protein IEQ34_015020 [Dendrobium chrysotoxum]|uniref:Uncharacterized protein n=1 Tax=Dendrobium chrysotoxum TaxID=161865 RepID=A0AAV7GNJ7_DENCH|nr:hypothetical protein IEQ34_015020 [Dendrobium chrysotoxum]